MPAPECRAGVRVPRFTVSPQGAQRANPSLSPFMTLRVWQPIAVTRQNGALAICRARADAAQFASEHVTLRFRREVISARLHTPLIHSRTVGQITRTNLFVPQLSSHGLYDARCEERLHDLPAERQQLQVPAQFVVQYEQPCFPRPRVGPDQPVLFAGQRRRGAVTCRRVRAGHPENVAYHGRARGAEIGLAVVPLQEVPQQGRGQIEEDPALQRRLRRQHREHVGCAEERPGVVVMLASPP